MLSLCLLLGFFAYSIGLFFVSDFGILTLIAGFNLLMALITRIPFKQYFKTCLAGMVLTGLIFLSNLLFTSPYQAALVAIRLFLVISSTAIMGQYFTPVRLQEAFTKLLSPLRIFGFNSHDAALSITLALALVPVFTSELKAIKLALRIKGFDFTLKNLIFHPEVFLTTFFHGLFAKVKNLEKSLTLKGY